MKKQNLIAVLGSIVFILIANLSRAQAIPCPYPITNSSPCDFTGTIYYSCQGVVCNPPVSFTVYANTSLMVPCSSCDDQCIDAITIVFTGPSTGTAFVPPSPQQITLTGGPCPNLVDIDFTGTTIH